VRFQHFVESCRRVSGEICTVEPGKRGLRDRYAGWPQYRRGALKAGGYRNGYYESGCSTVFGTIRLRIARAGAELSAVGHEGVTTPGPGSSDADPGSIPAAALDAASGPGGEHADRGVLDPRLG